MRQHNTRYDAHKSRQKPPKRLKPAGHSAAIEALIQPAIVIGSTLMSAIAAYVLALDEITHILNNQWQPSDWFIVALCAGMGFLIDMAIIVSATRYKMHAVRADPREDRWLTLAKWVLTIGLTSEAMTLFYFFVHLDPAAFPSLMVWLAGIIHAVLAVARAFLPPVVIAYFAAGVLPVMFDREDRNREILARTSSNIMLLIDKLSEVFDTDDKAELLRALGGQLMLNTYAKYDEVVRTSEDEQVRRDGKLIAHLGRMHRLDWSAIAADVAPELVTPALPALPTPTPPPPPAPPTGPQGGGRDHPDRADTQGGRDDLSQVPPVPMVSGLAPYQPSSLPAANGRRPVARNHAGNQARSVAGKSRGKRPGKSVGKSTGKRMLTYAQRNHQRVMEVRSWLAAGEQVSQQRIRKAFGVDNRRAKEILAEASQRALHVVGQ